AAPSNGTEPGTVPSFLLAQPETTIVARIISKLARPTILDSLFCRVLTQIAGSIFAARIEASVHVAQRHPSLELNIVGEKFHRSVAKARIDTAAVTTARRGLLFGVAACCGRHQ